MKGKDNQIISARDLERMGILKARTALRMAAIGLIPHYKFGERLHRVGFREIEVLNAMRRQPKTPSEEELDKGAA